MVVCERRRLPASEFSKKQVEKALDALKTLPEGDIRTSPDIQRTLYLSAVCKKCSEEREAREQAAAELRRDERRELAADEDAPGPPERVAVSLGDRPFGMTPAKAEGVGYLVAKVSEGKPAAQAGVRPGWRLVEVAGTVCEDLDLEAVQSMLRIAALPTAVLFEAVRNGAEFCTACQQVLSASLFSRKMRTKPPDKRRCASCVESAEGADANGERSEGAHNQHDAVDGNQKPQSKLAEFKQLVAESAHEAEKVTGIKAARGGACGVRGGRGRGRH